MGGIANQLHGLKETMECFKELLTDALFAATSCPTTTHHALGLPVTPVVETTARADADAERFGRQLQKSPSWLTERT